MNEPLHPPDAFQRSGERGPRSWTRHRPEPRNLWIRWRPRRWPIDESVFVDLATVCMATDSWDAAPADSLTTPEVESLDDTVYVPLGAHTERARAHTERARAHTERARGAALDGARRELAERVVAAGLPLVLQFEPVGAAEPRWERELEAGARARECDVLLVADLTAQLLRDRIPDQVLEGLGGAVAAVPLVAGMLDAARFAVLAADLARHGVRAVHFVPLSPSPAARRRLAQHLEREQDYRALFHARSPDEQELARIALDQGLATTQPRPLPKSPRRLRTNRLLAGHLAEAGDLWSRMEPSGREAAPFFRAARFVDESPHDLEALARDGNLRVLEWLESGPRELVEEALRDGKASVVEELRRRWLS